MIQSQFDGCVNSADGGSESKAALAIGVRLSPVLLVLLLGANTAAVHAQTKNGFDLTAGLVPADEILSGGPPRDGIPALDRPKFISTKEATFVRDSDRVLGIDRHRVAKAYPIAILNWHEIVNDRFGSEALVVSFCPLCGSGMAYRAEVKGRELRFGVSGLLYNSDLLLYDRETESLWSQVLARALSGPLRGTRLETLPLAHTTWGDWKKRHPDTLVLSMDTGHARDYTRNPYAGYEDRPELVFPVKFRASGYHPKERVIGIEIDGGFKAYPFVELAKGPEEIRDALAGRQITVRFDSAHESGAVYGPSGKEMPSLTAFWFAWYAFHPETEVYKAEGKGP